MRGTGGRLTLPRGPRCPQLLLHWQDLVETLPPHHRRKSRELSDERMSGVGWLAGIGRGGPRDWAKKPKPLGQKPTQ